MVHIPMLSPSRPTLTHFSKRYLPRRYQGPFVFTVFLSTDTLIRERHNYFYHHNYHLGFCFHLEVATDEKIQLYENRCVKLQY